MRYSVAIDEKKETWMRIAELIHATGQLISRNGPLLAVMGLYAGIVATYFDVI